ncbi:LPXTG cell wall anchor domain-containing protein [Microbacterium paraoxydans]
MATTGAEGMTWLAVAVGALALSALGAGLWRRRRS